MELMDGMKKWQNKRKQIKRGKKK